MNWYPNGNILSIVQWSRGKQHGLSEFYAEDGKLTGEAEYYNDLKDGVEKLYHDNGKIKALINWNMGAETGIETYWDPDGTLKQKIWWHEGQIVNAYKKKDADIKKKKDAAAAVAAGIKAARNRIKAKKTVGATAITSL
jgi:antitoxin component YwqK of YwqJK toxin-antitoxin module